MWGLGLGSGLDLAYRRNYSMSQPTGFDRLVIMSNPSQTEDRTIERKTAEPLEITNLLQTVTTTGIGGPKSSPSVTNFACDPEPQC
jgi:hypothetical protein